MKPWILLASALSLGACSSIIPKELPKVSPPLADMEEPLALTQEPKDEAERAKLPLGGFTGVSVADAKRTLEEMDEGGAGGVRVSRVIENSPGDAAGIAEGDLIVAATDAAGVRHAVAHPSQWRDVELAAAPGTVLHVTLDRAGAARTADIGVVARVRTPERQEAVRLREEDKVGVVLRTATEVEARAAGLGPGGGAVVVGLSAASPWRGAGVRYGDLITSIDGKEVAHPQVVLDVIRAAKKDATLTLEFVRDGTKHAVDAPLSRRATQISRFNVPLLFNYEADRGEAEWGAVLDLVSYRSTPAAWQLTLLWFVKLSGGDADRLVEVGK